MKSPKNKNDGPPSLMNITEEEASEESMLLWETVSKSARLNYTFSNLTRTNIATKPFLIRVFFGSERCLQLSAFQIKMGSIIKYYCNEFYDVENNNPGNVRIKVEYISNVDVTNNKWLPSQLIDHLLESDLHFILTHVHQGLTSKNIGWIIPSLLKHMKRLKFHPGFPSNEQLFCPVFTQDKIRYIRYLGEHFSIPTYEIRMTIPGSKYSSEELEKLRQYCCYYILLSNYRCLFI